MINDGGSPLESAMDPFATRLMTTYVRHPSKRGRAAALNTGLRLARGHYIAYLEEAVTYSPQHLEVLLQALREGKHQAAYTRSSAPLGSKETSSFSRDRLMVQNYIPLTSLLHLRSCIEDVGPFDEALGAYEDWELLIRMANRYPIAFVGQPTTNGSNASLTSPLAQLALQTIYARYHHLVADRPELLAEQAAHVNGLSVSPRPAMPLKQAEAPVVSSEAERTVAQASALLALGDPAGATQLLSTRLHLAASSAEFLLTLANCFVAQNDLASLRETLEHARRLHPSDVGIAARLAVLTLATVPAPVNLGETATAVSKTLAVEAAAAGSEEKQSRHRCVFVNTFYQAFLNAFRAQRPDLALASYGQQRDALIGTFFGDSDFYSSGLRKAGWDAEDLIVNDPNLARQWALETGFSSSHPLEVAIEQIRRLRPQVVYLQDLGFATQDFLNRIRPLTELIVGQIASPLPPQTSLQGIDIMFTSFPHFAQRFRTAGVTSYYQPLAFSERVLQGRQAGPRSRPLTFVGGLSTQHPAGTELLTRLAQATNIEIWGYGAEALAPDSPIRRRHHGEAWGQDMFRLLQESQITVNRHIGVAENHANNMRLFEATGCGALLITDYKDNLADLFDIGKEVVAYRTPDECEALIQYYQHHPEEAAQIARAGQARTLRDHGYDARMRDTAAILSRHVRHKREAPRFAQVDLGAISTGYKPMAAESVTPALVDAWKNEDLPLRQRALVHRELASMYKGRDIVPFKVLVDSLRPALAKMPAGPKSLLELGCASGYYYEILRFLLHESIDYTGVDYSPAMIALANSYYPEAAFTVADGAKLPFAEASFDVVVSCSVLLHVPNYHDHVRETARVARDLVVLHRTPVRRRHGTQHRSKQGYGIDMVELQFNENELNEVLLAAGLKIVSGIEYHADHAADDYGVTYVCKKVS